MQVSFSGLLQRPLMLSLHVASLGFLHSMVVLGWSGSLHGGWLPIRDKSLKVTKAKAVDLLGPSLESYTILLPPQPTGQS